MNYAKALFFVFYVVAMFGTALAAGMLAAGEHYLWAGISAVVGMFMFAGLIAD